MKGWCIYSFNEYIKKSLPPWSRHAAGEIDVIKVESIKPADSLDVREDEQVFTEHLLHVRHWGCSIT